MATSRCLFNRRSGRLASECVSIDLAFRGWSIVRQRRHRSVIAAFRSEAAATSDMSGDLTANQFIKKLKALRSAEELKKIRRYFKSGAGQYGEDDQFIGVRMGRSSRWRKRSLPWRPA